LDQHKFHGIKGLKSDAYGEEVRDALLESLMSLGSIVGLSKSWNIAGTMVDTHMKYNMAFIEPLCREDGAPDDFAALDLNLGFSNDSDNKDCLEMDDMFDFDCLLRRRLRLPCHYIRKTNATVTNQPWPAFPIRRKCKRCATSLQITFWKIHQSRRGI
jgi:hypothetical protein